MGVGADGVVGLTEKARRALEGAELVCGSARQLELIGSLIHGDTFEWPSPLSAGIAQLLARRGRRTCVLASGDPFFFGVGATLAAELTPSEWVCYPAPSSLSLAASRLGWALQDCDVVSLHGRDLANIVRFLQPGRRVLALSWNSATPSQLAELLVTRGFSASRLTVLENLGAESERVRTTSARDFALTDVHDLNLVALEVVADPGARVLPVRGSLPDHAFIHDGQLTKQDVRAITLTALAPRAGELLWDVGAGAGSIAIEWMLAHPACRAVAIESVLERCARIRENAKALGVPGLCVVEGAAPHGFADLPTPDAIFIGGGLTDEGVFERSYAALRAGGRLVANAVALESQARLFALYKAHGGELKRLSVENAAPLGTMTAFRPAFSVVQWRLTKS